MADLQRELSWLRSLRRRTMLQLGVATILTPLVLTRLLSSELSITDARWLAGIAAVLLSWALVRTVADTAAMLEQLCPACGDHFFGGLQRAAGALPIPPNECVSCRIGFDGQRAPRQGGLPGAGAGPGVGSAEDT